MGVKGNYEHSSSGACGEWFVESDSLPTVQSLV